MDMSLIALVLAGGGVLGVVVWALAKVGKALIKIAEALAAAAVVVVAVWLMIKALVWALRQVLTHWRTSLTVVAMVAWWQWWGGPSLAITAGVLTGWRLVDLASFDTWAGRHLRSWWLRWTVYAPKLPQWLHACGLSTKPDAMPMVVTVNPLGRSIRRGQRQTQARYPRRSGCAPAPRGTRSASAWCPARTRRLRRGRPGTGLGPGSDPLPGPRTVPQRGLGRFPAPQPVRRPRGLPRPRHPGRCRGQGR